MTDIKGFFGEYRFLSNFWMAEIVHDGIIYPSTEHAYQVAKTVDDDQRIGLMWVTDPDNTIRPTTVREVKRLGKTVTLRYDWEAVKFDVMSEVVHIKFQSHHDLACKLLATGDKYLEETNTWNDQIWGVCNGIGKNWLGLILMDVRKTLRRHCNADMPGSLRQIVDFAK